MDDQKTAKIVDDLCGTVCRMYHYFKREKLPMDLRKELCVTYLNNVTTVNPGYYNQNDGGEDGL